MMYRRVTVVLILVFSLSLPISVFASDDLTVSVQYTETCGDASLSIDVGGGEGPFNILVRFGDGDEFEISDVLVVPFILNHTYPSQGDYEYSVKVKGLGDAEGEAEGIVEVGGPSVVLESNPSPPLLPLGSEGTKIDFTAVVSGGQETYAFEWDLNEDGVLEETVDPTSNTATFTYTEEGKLEAKVKVTDACEFTAEDELTVYIIDPTAEEEPDADGEELSPEGEDAEPEGESEAEKGCHPTAQRITDALNLLSPDQREGEYTCEDIFNFFQDEEGGLHHSFGLLWRSYQMTQVMDELTWEDILDWHLEGSGWGVLQQLNRFAESLDEVGIADLYERVMSGENSIGDIRSAARAALRFDADFEDALERLEGGISSGALNQLYRTALEMEIEPSALDEYLEEGVSLTQIRHATKLADQTGSEWQVLLGAYTSGYDWGEIRKAFRLADETTDFETILEIGTDAYRDQQRALDREERNLEQDERTAMRLAEQYGFDYKDILMLHDLACDGDWNCMRDLLRDQAKAERNANQDDSTLTRIAEKYGVSEQEVWQVYIGSCGGNWSCVREYFRDQTKENHGKGPK